MSGDALYICIYPWDTAKGSSSPCCNAACQLGSLLYTSSWPLPFPHLLKSSGLAHVSASVIRCKEACGPKVTWLSHRMGSCRMQWPMENPPSEREGMLLTLGKCLCSDPGAAVPLLSDSPFPLPHVGALLLISLVFWERAQ